MKVITNPIDHSQQKSQQDGFDQRCNEMKKIRNPKIT